MIIKRELQGAVWQFDTIKQKLIIRKRPPIQKGTVGFTDEARLAGHFDIVIELDRVYMFSLSRFLIRSFQKMSQKQRKEVKKSENSDS